VSRIRSIHPGLWTDEAFVSLSPMARLLIMGIWNECDDMGSFAWAPLTLKMRILPADNADASELLAEMVSAGIVMRYEVAGKAYGAVRNFCQFQRPKKPNSTCPQTDEVREWVNTEARSTRDGAEEVPNQLPTAPEKCRQMEDGGGDRDNSEATASSSVGPDNFDDRKAVTGACLEAAFPVRKHLIPVGWVPPPVSELTPRAKACAEQWSEASYMTEAEAFVLYWRTERKMKTDWPATWANRVIARHSAVMRDQKFGNGPPSAKKEKNAVELRELAEWYVRHGQQDRADECRQKAIKLEQRTAA
jgi:hypothetical protein